MSISGQHRCVHNDVILPENLSGGVGHGDDGAMRNALSAGTTYVNTNVLSIGQWSLSVSKVSPNLYFGPRVAGRWLWE